MSEISTAFASARELILNVRPTELSDRLAGSGTHQDYTFTLTSRSDVSLTLSKLSGNADLELYRGGETTEALKLTSSANPDLTPEIIGTTLDAGTYYVRVSPDRARIKALSSSTTSSALDSTSLPIDYALKLSVSTLDDRSTPDRPTRVPPLFWHNGVTGQLYAWQMTGADYLTIGSFRELITVPTDWAIAAVVDWDKDGTADLVWRNQQAGQAVVWFMGGDDGTILRDYQSLQNVPSEWEIAAVTDWNQDGTQDLIWRTSQGSQSVVWLMDPTNNLLYKDYKILTEVPSNWQIVAAADWNMDGVSDLLWRDRVSGTNVLWLMGGEGNLTITGTQTLITVPLSWDIVGVSDWNQDGFKDIVWRNTRGGGENVVWFMGGDNDPFKLQRDPSFLTIPVEWTLTVADRKTVPGIPDAIGNTLLTAMNLNGVQRAQFSDWIGAQDSLDVYGFDVTEGATRLSVTLNIAGDLASSGLDLWLLDATGKRIDPIAPTGSQSLKLQQFISQSLDPGKYYLQVRSQGATVTPYNLKVDSFGIENWLKQNIEDAGLKETLRSSVQDGVIDRSDVIALLRSATDGTVVDETEFTDLKNVVRDFYELSNDTIAKKTAPWFNLLSKLVNGDTANATYNGSALGNLTAGSSSVQMTALIDKWFLGGDRPTTQFVYRSAVGKLFQNGVSYKDINQGDLSNSPFLAALGALAVTSPNDVRSLFLDNGDGTFTVRFLKPDRTADYVTIDRFLPIDPESDLLIYARQYSTVGNGRAFDDPANELWAALLEKAFTQWLASGWVSGPKSGTIDTVLGNRYPDLAIVGYENVLSALSGRSVSTKSVTTLSPSALLNAIETSSPVSFVSKIYSTTLGAEIVSRQTYTLVGYDPLSSTFTLFNPWGLFNQYSDLADPKSNRKPGEISLSIDQIIENFDTVYGTV